METGQMCPGRCGWDLDMGRGPHEVEGAGEAQGTQEEVSSPGHTGRRAGGGTQASGGTRHGPPLLGVKVFFLLLFI